MRTTLLLLVLLAGPALAGQTVWKWVDERGVTHFSDRPVPGATKMELSGGGNTASAAPTSASSSIPSSESREEAGPPYRDLEIWKPGDGEVMINTGGQVSINIRVSPPLQAGHSLYLYLDGKLVEGYAGNTLSFDLKEVPRGEHVARAVVIDQGGKRVQETAPVKFIVRQESIAQPPVGPTLRPPPRPPRQSNAKPLTTQPSYAALNGQRSVQVDPVTNKPVVTKPNVTTPTVPGSRSGK